MQWLGKSYQGADLGPAHPWFFHRWAKTGQEIGVIFDVLSGQFVLIRQIVEHIPRGVLLAEGIIANRDVVYGQVTEHTASANGAWVTPGHCYGNNLRG